MHLNKILVLGCSRSGTTEFCKTLQEISSKKLVWEPNGKNNETIIGSFGVNNFLNKLYEDDKTFGVKWGMYHIWNDRPSKYTLEVIDYHDLVFFLSRRNVFQQALSLNIAKQTEKWRAVDFGVETISQKEKEEYNKLSIGKIELDVLKKDITNIKEISSKTIDYLKGHKNYRVLFYEDIFGFLSGVKLNTEDNYKNIENWEELKNFYEQNKDFCHFDL